MAASAAIFFIINTDNIINSITILGILNGSPYIKSNSN